MKKESYLTIDDRHEMLNLYESKCGCCKNRKNYECQKFPNGIPENYLLGIDNDIREKNGCNKFINEF